MGARLRYPRRAALVAAFIAVLGPPVGLIAYLAVIEGLAVLSGTVRWQPMGPILAALGWLVFYSYIFGVVPAAISAMAIGRVVWRWGTVSYRICLLTAVAAGVVGAAFNAMWFVARSGKPVWAINIAGLTVLIGLAAALICRWAMGRFGLLPPGSREANKS